MACLIYFYHFLTISITPPVKPRSEWDPFIKIPLNFVSFPGIFIVWISKPLISRSWLKSKSKAFMQAQMAHGAGA